jgi:hypothetical protein
MQLSKLCFTVGAMVWLTGFATVRAGDTDNPDQARARAALERAMRESSSPSAAQIPVQSVQPLDANDTARAEKALWEKLNAQGGQGEKASSSAASVSSTPTKTLQPLDTNDIARAERALWEKLNAQSGQAEKASSPAPGVSYPPTTQLNSQNQAKAQAALEQKMAEMNQQQMQTQASSRTAPQSIGQPYLGKGMGLQPMEPPPPPVSATQEAELHALLRKYMANLITPEQYQAERAKIMAEK